MIVIRKYSNLAEARFKISGGIVGGSKTNTLFDGLVGKTLTLLNPTGSCTFTQPIGTPYGQLRFADVRAQVMASAGLGNAEVVTVGNLLGIRHKISGQAIRLDAMDEAARTILGFENNSYIGGLVLNGPSGALPRYLEFVAENGAVCVSAEFSNDDSASVVSFSGGYAVSFDGAHARANG